MSGEWRIVMDTGAAELIEHALRCTDLDIDREGNVVYCYVDAPHNPKRVRKELKHDLAAFGFAESVPDPLPDRALGREAGAVCRVARRWARAAARCPRAQRDSLGCRRGALQRLRDAGAAGGAPNPAPARDR